MSSSRLQSAPTNPLFASLAHSQVIQRGQPSLARVAKLALPEELPNAILERLVAGDAKHHAAALRLLSGFGATFANLSAARTALSYGVVRLAAAAAGLHLVQRDWARAGGLSPVALLRQAVAAALAAEKIAPKDLEAPVAALVANLGVPAAAAVEATGYAQVTAALVGATVPVAQAERLVLQTNHGEIAEILLREAGFAANVVAAVAGHAEPPANAGRLTHIVHVAEAVAHQLGFDGGLLNAPGAPDAKAMAALGLDEAKLGTLAMNLNAELQPWMDGLATLD